MKTINYSIDTLTWHPSEIVVVVHVADYVGTTTLIHRTTFGADHCVHGHCLSQQTDYLMSSNG